MSKISETGDKERFEIRPTIGWVSIFDEGEPILHVVRDDSKQNPDPTLRPAVSKETQARAEMILSALREYGKLNAAINAYKCLCEMQLADAQTLERVVAERDAVARERDEARQIAALAMGEANTAMADAFAESKRAAQCERYAALYLALRDSGRFAPGVGGAGWASACRRPETMDDADRAALDAAAEALLPSANARKDNATCWGITDPAEELLPCPECKGTRTVVKDHYYQGCQACRPLGSGPREAASALRAAADDEYLVAGDGRAVYSPSELDALADEIIKDMTEGGQE